MGFVINGSSLFCVGKSVNHESSADYVNGVVAESPYLEDRISLSIAIYSNSGQASES